MTDTDELEGPKALIGGQLCELALRCVRAGEQLLADVIGAGLAQVFEPVDQRRDLVRQRPR